MKKILLILLFAFSAIGIYMVVVKKIISVTLKKKNNLLKLLQLLMR